MCRLNSTISATEPALRWRPARWLACVRERRAAWRGPAVFAVFALFATLLPATPVLAQNVVLAGVLGQRALLSVDGAPARSLAIGQTYQGVTLLAVRSHEADVESAGQRQTLRLGEGPVHAAAAERDVTGARRIVMHASSNGHFRASGQINGRAVDFLVDTGASVVSMSQAVADSIGLKYQDGNRFLLNTANGQVVGWQTRIDRLRLGDVEIYGIEAMVSPSSMPYVLLGNSYLTRFQMTRTNDELVLEQRY
jgi:aspartyl protease family protein